MRRGLHWLSLLLILSGCAAPTEKALDERSEGDRSGGPRVVDALFVEGRLTLDVPTLIAMAPLPEGAPVVVATVGADEHSSHHVVALRDAEPLHRHDHHDLLAVILRGHGRMWIEGEERQIGVDSITFIPRGAAHSLRNDGDEPIVGYVVYWPPYDGQDRVLVEWPWP